MGNGLLFGCLKGPSSVASLEFTHPLAAGNLLSGGERYMGYMRVLAPGENYGWGVFFVGNVGCMALKNAGR